jgi:hypothetical protein
MSAPLPKMAGVVVPQAAGWRALCARGFADLSPPEAEHALLELPANRAEYVSVLQDIGDYPVRSPIGHRVPADAEVAALARMAGRWRAIVLLDDERALRNAAVLFSRVFVLDPLYDSGALLYAAMHDPIIKDEHARALAEQGGLLVRASPLLNAGTAILAPDHLPGSWNPRPGWRKPRPTAATHERAAWSMRTSLVLLYWADRLDGVVCTTHRDVVAALDVVLGGRTNSSDLELIEQHCLDGAQAARDGALADLSSVWATSRRLTRRRGHRQLGAVGESLTSLAQSVRPQNQPTSWRLALGRTSLPDPALLIRRVLNGEDPARQPPLPEQKIRRRPLCLRPVSF